MFACEYCNYGSIHKHNVTRHEKRHHANHATTTFSVQQNQMQTKDRSKIDQRAIDRSIKYRSIVTIRYESLRVVMNRSDNSL